MARTRIGDLTGVRFGRLLVQSEATRIKGKRCWLCLCDCGKTKVIKSDSLTLRNRPTRSCGCLQRENASNAVRKHGYYLSPEYGIWENIIQRCTNPNYTYYDRYGGRGITICKAWRESFPQFLADMGPRPSPRHTVERTDNNGHYEPGNCRWATRIEQQRNRSNARLITFEGRTETAHMWSKITGLPSRTITNRLNAGWEPHRILKTPALGRGRRHTP